MKILDRQKGFTLIELMVVISIIGVLSTIAMTSLNGARAKARDARRKNDLEQISLAMEQYYSDHGTYQVAGSGYDGCSCGWFNSQDGSHYAKSVGNGLKEAGYFTVVPRDPNNATPQYMIYLCGGGFYVYAKLEAPNSYDTAAYNASCKSPNTIYGMNYAAGHR